VGVGGACVVGFVLLGGGWLGFGDFLGVPLSGFFPPKLQGGEFVLISVISLSF